MKVCGFAQYRGSNIIKSYSKRSSSNTMMSCGKANAARRQQERSERSLYSEAFAGPAIPTKFLILGLFIFTAIKYVKIVQVPNAHFRASSDHTLLLSVKLLSCRRTNLRRPCPDVLFGAEKSCCEASHNGHSSAIACTKLSLSNCIRSVH